METILKQSEVVANSLRKRPLLFMAVAYITGLSLHIVLPRTLFAPSPELLPILILITVLYFLKQRVYTSIPLMILAFAFGLILYDFKDSSLPSHHIAHMLTRERVTLKGVVSSAPEYLSDRTRLYLDAEKIFLEGKEKETTGKVMITLYERVETIRYGDRIVVRDIRLRSPRNFLNKGSFDYESFMRGRGIYATGGVSRGDKITIVERGVRSALFSVVYDFKEAMLRGIDRAVQEPQASMMKATILGERRTLNEEVQEVFTRSGIIHLISVSGLHVGFVAWMFFVMFRMLSSLILFDALPPLPWIIRPSRVAILLSIFPVLLYALLIGDNAPTTRSTIMAVTYLLAALLGRGKDLLNLLSLAALIILFWHPQAILDASFQLSFLLVLIIIWAVSVLPNLKLFQKEESSIMLDLQRKIAAFILVSLSVTVGSFPLIAYHFNQITPLSFFTNLIVIPLSSIAIPLGLIGAGLAPFSEFLSTPLLKGTGVLFEVIYFVAKRVASLSIATFDIPTPSLVTVVSCYLLLFTLLHLKRRWLSRVAVAISFCAVVLSLIWQLIPPSPDGKLRVTFLDVGQGEATFMKFPDGQTMLIDGGGSTFGTLDIGRAVVVPYLYATRIGKIDLMVATHPHPDHIKGLQSVAQLFKVDRFWSSGVSSWNEEYQKLQAILEGKKVRGENVLRGMIWEPGSGVKVSVLHPTDHSLKILSKGEKAENNNSVVIKVTHGEVSFLMTGDLEKEGERDLLQSGLDLQSTILKAAHHGSKTSSTEPFLKKVNPQIAVISLGSENRFGFPDSRVLQRYGDQGVKVYRTDLGGAIEVVSDGKEYKITTYREERKGEGVGATVSTR
ncbi:MAG: DNA internalization-related competence protein ComEC/Rec2 [Candidatus Tectomicrobia bacterium]|nr:DNA internalization-related competence protein ComEC/Rec2 [Candidatus Tectomicrobia bacterium]